MKVVVQQFLFRLHGPGSFLHPLPSGRVTSQIPYCEVTLYYQSVRFVEALVLVGSSGCCLEL